MKTKFNKLLSTSAISLHSTSRNVILFCLISIIITLLSINVNAEEKEYEIPNAEFYVTLLENGDAAITEVWTVEYQKGNFTRFYKDIYKNVSSIEEFSNFDIYNCRINGNEVIETNSMNREHNHFYIQNSIDTYSINWFYEASKETVEYEITYLLSDIVKETDNEKAIFCYRFIGVDFEKEVENTYVEIIMPDDTFIELRYGEEDNYNIEDNRIVLEQNNVKGLLKYNIVIDSDIFDDLNYISLDKIKAEESDEELEVFLENIIEFIIVMFIISIFVFFVLLFIFLEKREQKKFDKFLNENPNYFNQLMNKYNNIHPLILLNSNNQYLSTYQNFIITLLDLCRRNEAYITRDYLIFSKNINNIQNFEKDVLNLFFKYFKYDDYGTYFSFNLNNIGEILKDKTIAKEFASELRKAFSNIPRNKNVVNKNEIKLLYRYFKKFNNQYNNPAYDYFKLVERTHTIDYLLILGFAFVKQKTNIISDDEFEILEDVCELLENTFIEVEHSNSSGSGCSSCSSCSSCSGCGGGGAD